MVTLVKTASAGLLMKVKYLTMVTRPAPVHRDPGRRQVSDKIDVIANLMKIVDKLLIGGAMAHVSESQGQPTGKSGRGRQGIAGQNLLALRGGKLLLPVDHVVAAELKEGAASQWWRTFPMD
jgi:3-phosphoglycerate kinase